MCNINLKIKSSPKDIQQKKDILFTIVSARELLSIMLTIPFSGYNINPTYHTTSGISLC